MREEYDANQARVLFLEGDPRHLLAHVGAAIDQVAALRQRAKSS
jgi:hypothetical protein